MGYGKLAWFADSAHLTYELEQWLSFEPVAISRWYLEWVAMPGAPCSPGSSCWASWPPARR